VSSAATPGLYLLKTQAKKVDIDKMHAYRDAIRDQSGTRVVRYAATLYPGPELHYAEGLEKPLEKKIEALMREALDPMAWQQP
jgi:PD-(D/E)XK nuclease superfamily